MPPPSFLSLIILLFSSIPITTQTSHRHIIKIPSSIPRPAGLSYDPFAQHFIIFSSSHPIISSISDAGVTETIISSISLLSLISSISIDNRRRRLLVSLRNPHKIAAFDLRSPRPHRLLFSSPLPFPPAAIAVDPHTGSAFITGSDAGVIWRVDLDGKVSNFSKSEIYGGEGEGLVAAAHVRNGFLLAVQGKMGRMFKVDEESGAAREVIGRNWSPAPETKGIVLMGDGNAVVACERGVRMVKSVDGWAEAAVTGEVRVEGGRRFEGVATRDGKKAYVLAMEDEEGGGFGGRIEEVEWEEEGDLLWLMVMIGFGLAYVLYWRFQMRQLVTNMNKKQA